MALARKARETADGAYYDQALQEVEKALAVSPGNFEALKARTWALLGKHQFADALALAQQLNKRVPDDVMVYGLLVDAHAELGNYAEAEKAAQWMLDMGRGSVPGLTRAAYLREIFGDIDGALELMLTCYRRLDRSDNEDRAWMLTQIAHLLTHSGRIEEASQQLQEALRLMPDYHYALAALARVRTAEGKHDDAVRLLVRRYEKAPHPENLFDLAVAQHKAGRLAAANAAFAEFERKALAESESWDNANRELIAYYTDYANKPAAAIRIARMEVERRRDVHTLDAYAWALHRNGRSAEARKQIEAALAVGTKDPGIAAHASAIGGATRSSKP